jgi:hypothetical protein
LFVPQILFSGFFIRTSLIPIYMRWAQYLCSLKYAINLLLIIEFGTCDDQVSFGLICLFVSCLRRRATQHEF